MILVNPQYTARRKANGEPLAFGEMVVGRQPAFNTVDSTGAGRWEPV
jgi:hypothetical protein